MVERKLDICQPKKKLADRLTKPLEGKDFAFRSELLNPPD
jgi:hypothetical protein